MKWLKRLFPWRREPLLSHLQIRLYTRAGCHLCEDVAHFLQLEKARYRFQLQTVSIDAEPELLARYGESVPVVTINDKVRFRGAINVVLWRRLVRVEQQRAQRRA